MGSVIHSGGQAQAGYSMSSGSGYNHWSGARRQQHFSWLYGHVTDSREFCQEYQSSGLLRHHKARKFKFRCKFKLAKSKFIVSCDLQWLSGHHNRWEQEGMWWCSHLSRGLRIQSAHLNATLASQLHSCVVVATAQQMFHHHSVHALPFPHAGCCWLVTAVFLEVLNPTLAEFGALILSLDGLYCLSHSKHMRWLSQDPPSATETCACTTSFVCSQEDKQGKVKAEDVLDDMIEIKEIRFYICLGCICVRQ